MKYEPQGGRIHKGVNKVDSPPMRWQLPDWSYIFAPIGFFLHWCLLFWLRWPSSFTRKFGIIIFFLRFLVVAKKKKKISDRNVLLCHLCQKGQLDNFFVQLRSYEIHK